MRKGSSSVEESEHDGEDEEGSDRNDGAAKEEMRSDCPTSSSTGSSEDEDEDEDETLDLNRLKNMISVASHLAKSTDGAIDPYEELVDTVENVFGSVRNLGRSFATTARSDRDDDEDCGVRLSDVRKAFGLLSTPLNVDDTEHVPKRVTSALIESLSDLAQCGLRNTHLDAERTDQGDQGTTRSKRNRNKSAKALRVARSFLIVLLGARMLMSIEHHATILQPLLVSLSKCGTPIKRQLTEWWSRFPRSYISELVVLMQHFVTIKLYSPQVGDPFGETIGIGLALKCLKLLADANETHRRRSGRVLIPASDFYNDAVNKEISFEEDTRRWIRRKPSFCDYPFVVNTANKAIVLKLNSRFEMQQQMRHAFMDAFLGSGGMLSPYNVLKVRRDEIVDDSLRELQRRSSNDLKKPLKVKFIGEEGVDEGGVQKEYFQVITRQLIDPKYGMFTRKKSAFEAVVAQHEDNDDIDDDDDSPRRKRRRRVEERDLAFNNNYREVLWLNGRSFEAPVRFELVGTLLGVAIYNGVLIDLRFPMVLYEKLMGRTPGLSALMQIEPDLHRGLSKLLTYSKMQVEDCDLTFEVTEEAFGAIHVVPLKPDGGNVSVTIENRQEYVDLYADHVLNKSVKKQFDALRRGFLKACGGRALDLFRHEELELLICGEPELDFHDLERVARYEDGYKAHDPVIRHFWSVVHDMSKSEQRKLLTFVTGSDRAPINGLGSLKFVISKIANDVAPRRAEDGTMTGGRLPSAHTCFNHLLLPHYDNKETLRRCLLAAISQSEGFGLL